MDPDQVTSTLRPLWPVVEKKQEIEFRRAVFNVYKTHQVIKKTPI